MRIALILSTGMITPPSPSEAEERIKQFQAGFGQVAELVKKYPDFDVFPVDSTLHPGFILDERVQNAINSIPNLQETNFFWDNELGKINKGCGLIIQWRRVLPKIAARNYEYIIHYEPRQFLLDFSFFERFVKKNANYFKATSYRITASTKAWPVRFCLKIIPVYRHNFWTGLFSLETALFKDFVTSTDLNRLAKKKVSLEDYMYQKLDKSQIYLIDRLGLLWHNSFDYKTEII